MGIFDKLLGLLKLKKEKKIKEHIKKVSEKNAITPQRETMELIKQEIQKTPLKIPKKDVPKIEPVNLEKQLGKYRKTISELRKKIQELEEKVNNEKVNPTNALGGIQVIYREMKDEKKNIDKEIRETKELMDFIEKRFLKRQVSEETFRKKMLDYEEKMHLLKLEKKELSVQKKQLKETKNQLPEMVPISLDQIAKSQNVEKLLEKQQETLDLLAKNQIKQQEALEQQKDAVKAAASIANSITPQKPGQKTKQKSQPQNPIQTNGKQRPEKQSQLPKEKTKQEKDFKEDIKVINKTTIAKNKEKDDLTQLIQEKGSNVSDDEMKKLQEKLNLLVDKYDVPHEQIKQKIDSSDDLVATVNKLASIIELEKRADQKLKTEKIETAFKTTEPIKYDYSKEEGEETEVKANAIITDFDQVLSFINEKGKVKLGKIAKELKMTRKRVEECCSLLEKEKQIIVNYPAIGDATAETIDYKEKQELEKLKKKNKKR